MSILERIKKAQRDFKAAHNIEPTAILVNPQVDAELRTLLSSLNDAPEIRRWVEKKGHGRRSTLYLSNLLIVTVDMETPFDIKAALI